MKNLGFIEGFVSVILNFLIFIFKIIVGKSSKSIAMISDAWHTLSDSFTSIIVIFGFYLAKRGPDKKHPFGHQRAEQIGGIIIGTLLFLVGLNFLKESINRLIIKERAIFNLTGIIIFLISALLKEGLALFSYWAGKKIDSYSLIADAWHHRSDAIASFLIVIGSILGRKFWFIDSILGIIVSMLILYSAYEIIKNTGSVIIGEDISNETKVKIENIIKSISDKANDIHHLHIHSYGDHKEVTLHLRLPSNYSIKRAHKIATDIENEIRKETGLEITVHIEPEKD
jgi:cation diffusion facilitator family transporter